MVNVVENPKQFNISLSPELKKRLQDLANEFEMEKGSKVGAEIIRTYVEKWAVLEAATRARRKQLLEEEEQRMLDYISGQQKHPPLVKQSQNPGTSAKRNKRR